MIKRLIDIIVSMTVLIGFSPLLLILCLLVCFKLGRPIFFSQKRPGLDEKIFTMYKFRSMLSGVNEKGQLLPDEQRLTPFGINLRSASLDELPGFWSVLKGDMSLVGPRPLLIAYLPLYNKQQERRHNVKPGITGWAQVNGRNSLTWEDKFKFDVWYVDNQSFSLDLKILLLTIKKVFIKEGIAQEGVATMMAFNGSQKVKSSK